MSRKLHFFGGERKSIFGNLEANRKRKEKTAHGQKIFRRQTP